MFKDAKGTPYERARIIVRWTWIIPLLAALYVGGVFYQRHLDSQRLERELEEKQREAGRRAFEATGGGRFEILHFYAAPGVARRGEQVQVCYGVSGAAAVRLEPHPQPVPVSAGRCLRVTLQRDTTYTLTIEDGQGNTRSATLTVRVE